MTQTVHIVTREVIDYESQPENVGYFTTATAAQAYCAARKADQEAFVETFMPNKRFGYGFDAFLSRRYARPPMTPEELALFVRVTGGEPKATLTEAPTTMFHEASQYAGVIGMVEVGDVWDTSWDHEPVELLQ